MMIRDGMKAATNMDCEGYSKDSVKAPASHRGGQTDSMDATSNKYRGEQQDNAKGVPAPHREGQQDSASAPAQHRVGNQDSASAPAQHPPSPCPYRMGMLQRIGGEG